MLVPDLNATGAWRKKLTLFNESGIKATLFEKLEQMNGEAIGNAGIRKNLIKFGG